MEENEYILLILKHLSQETSPAEQAGLLQWLEADPANRREYQAVEKIWQDSGSILQEKLFDKETAWKKVTGKLALPAGQPRLFPWKKMMAAASIALLLGFGGWWYYIQKNPSFFIIDAETASRQFTLPDGSVIDLRKGAILKYRKTFNTGDRQVELTGEAFFQLKHDATSPFRITTNHAFLEDMGTSFLVKENNDSDVVIVETGKVKFIDRDDPTHSVVLLPGRKAALRKDQFTQNAANPNFMAWRTGVLDFRGEPLLQVAEDLSAFYQVKISISPDLQPSIAKLVLTARFEHQPLEQVIEEIKLMTNLTITREKDTLAFSLK